MPFKTPRNEVRELSVDPEIAEKNRKIRDLLDRALDHINHEPVKSLHHEERLFAIKEIIEYVKTHYADDKTVIDLVETERVLSDEFKKNPVKDHHFAIGTGTTDDTLINLSGKSTQIHDEYKQLIQRATEIKDTKPGRMRP